MVNCTIENELKETRTKSTNSSSDLRIENVSKDCSQWFPKYEHNLFDTEK